MALASHQFCCRRVGWFWVNTTTIFLLLLIAGAGASTGSSLDEDDILLGANHAAADEAAAFPIHKVREIFSNATVEELAEFPPDVLDMIFNHEPPSSMSRSLLFGRDNNNNNNNEPTSQTHENIDDQGSGDGRLSISFFRCFGRELRAMQNQFDQKEYKRMVLSEAGIDDEQQIRKVLREEAKNDGTRFRRTPMAQSIFTALSHHSDEFLEVYNMYEACQQEVDSKTTLVSLSGEENGVAAPFSAEGSGIRAGQAFLQAMNRDPKVRRRLQTSAPSATPSLAPSVSPSASPSSNGFVNLGFHVEVGIIGDYSFSSFNGDTSSANAAGCLGRKSFNRNCVGVEAGAGFEFSFMMLFDSQKVAPSGQSCWFDFDIGIGTAAGFGVGNYLSGIGQQFEVSVGSGFGIGMGGAWCWDFNTD